MLYRPYRSRGLVLYQLSYEVAEPRDPFNVSLCKLGPHKPERFAVDANLLSTPFICQLQIFTFLLHVTYFDLSCRQLKLSTKLVSQRRETNLWSTPKNVAIFCRHYDTHACFVVESATANFLIILANLFLQCKTCNLFKFIALFSYAGWSRRPSDACQRGIEYH